MNDITFNILKIVISIVSALVAAYLIPLLKNKLSQDKYNELLNMIEIAVYAAEQTIGSGNGNIKKQEVIVFVSNWMREKGIQITDDQLSQLIESAVFSMNKEIK